MATYSQNLRLNLIASGAEAGTWGNTTNYNLGTLLEAAISGLASVSVTSTSQVLTANNGVADESRDAILQLNSGGISAAFSLYAPPASKMYVVFNNTSYAATIYNSATLGSTTPAGTGVSVAAGDKAFIFSNGTNFYNISAASIAGIIPVPNGGTGVATLTGLAYGNGTSAFTAASAAQIVAAIGATAVTNATNATNATNLTTANFSIVQSGSKLYFKYGATNIASLDSSGNLVVLANVTGYGTP